MKKNFCIYKILFITLCISLCACSNRAENHQEPLANLTNDPTTSADESNVIQERSKVSGFNELTNQTIAFHGIEFSVPSYFDVQDEQSTDTFLHYYPAEKDYYCSLIFVSEDVSITQSHFDENRAVLDDSFLQIIGDDATLVDSKNVDIAGRSGRIISCTAKNDNDITIYHFGVVYISESKTLISIREIYDSNDQSRYDYDGDFTKILESAILLPQESLDGSESDTIRPEFKEAMDSYEAFFDEYSAFMKKYQSSSNSFEMLADYMDYLTRYTETMEKLDAIGESDLSTEELAYYTEVTARISTKLMQSIS